MKDVRKNVDMAEIDPLFGVWTDEALEPGAARDKNDKKDKNRK